MKLVNIHAVNDVRVDEVPVPSAGPNDVVVKVAACGVCGSDLTFIKLGGAGAPGTASPMPLGHEAAGVVTEVGANVADVYPGMRVIINPIPVAGQVMGNGGTEGAFTDFLLVRDAALNRNLYAVPEGMPLHIAALTEPLGVARHGVNRAKPQRNSKCTVFGVGPIGLGAVLWLKRMGVKSIVAIDVSDERLAAARVLGATDTIVAGRGDLFAKLTELHGPATSIFGPAVGTDIFFDFAGASQVLTDVIELAKTGATLLVVAIHPSAETIDFTKLVVKEISIIGSCGYPDEYPSVIADLASMGADAEKLISHRLPFSKFNDAIAMAKLPTSTKVMVEF